MSKVLSIGSSYWQAAEFFGGWHSSRLRDHAGRWHVFDTSINDNFASDLGTRLADLFSDLTDVKFKGLAGGDQSIRDPLQTQASGWSAAPLIPTQTLRIVLADSTIKAYRYAGTTPDINVTNHHMPTQKAVRT